MNEQSFKTYSVMLNGILVNPHEYNPDSCTRNKCCPIPPEWAGRPPTVHPFGFPMFGTYEEWEQVMVTRAFTPVWNEMLFWRAAKRAITSRWARIPDEAGLHFHLCMS